MTNANDNGMQHAKTDAARELALWAINDGKFYAATIQPIIADHGAKMADCTYDKQAARYVWLTAANSAAAAYCQEFSKRSDWPQIFDLEDRRQVAAEFADRYSEEIQEATAAALTPRTPKGWDKV